MKKSTTKYIYSITLAAIIFVFLIDIITYSIIELSRASILSRLLIQLVSAIFTGSLIAIGLSILNPVISDAMITLRRMLRTESLSNPILMKLSSEAPGTYHHSLNVSTLAQKAAKSIGADSLLVRTAAYYHDLGKLDKPYLYVENQAGIEVPTQEDAESIKKNANQIISHVEKGQQMAEEAKLPDEIIDLITEHHGTSRALYFYGIAKEKGLKIKKTDFRYKGPVPQSKESAILMLADCVEATARAMPHLDNQKITAIVHNAIEERLADNQFKNCHLNERDFAKIQSSLVETLCSIYHQRIEYGTKENHS